MKLFIKKITRYIFLSLFLVLFITISIKTIEIYNLNKFTTNNKKLLSKSINIFGHSHPQTAINPIFYTDFNNTEFRLINNAKGGQSTFWSVMTARHAYNLGCRNFIFEISNGSFTSSWKTSDRKRGSREIQKIIMCNIREIVYLTKQKNTIYLLKSFLFNYNPPKSYLDGEYQSLSHSIESKEFNNIDDREETMQITTVKKNTSVEEVDFETDLILDFISNHPDCVFLVFRAPLHRSYNLTPSTQQQMSNFTQRLISSKVKFLDCVNWISEDSLFADPMHLNKKGAEIFSKRINKHIYSLFDGHTI